jgi:hypothetical protein
MLTTEQRPTISLPSVTEPLRELTVALQREIRLTHDLGEALVQQRNAVANDDADAVNASVEAIGRILLTLNEARSRRTGIVSSITGNGPVPLDRLEQLIGQPLPTRLSETVMELRRSAQKASHEVAINWSVLRRAVETGEAFLQTLFSSVVDPEPVYRPSDRKEEGRGGPGFLVDRMV